MTSPSRGATRSCAAVDLGSLNGTYLNGVGASQAAMGNGDLLQIRKFKLFAPDRAQS